MGRGDNRRGPKAKQRKKQRAKKARIRRKIEAGAKSRKRR